MAAPVKNGTRVRKSPVAKFNIVEALPENPKREVAGGFGTSKWVGILTQVKDEAPVNVWVEVMEYQTAHGAREAINTLRENGSVFPAVDDGFTWLADDRRSDTEVPEVDENGAETGQTVTERHSSLFVGIWALDNPEVKRVSDKIAAREEAQARRAATRAANKAAKEAAEAAGETYEGPDPDVEDTGDEDDD